jgi:hypothetical protein
LAGTHVSCIAPFDYYHNFIGWRPTPSSWPGRLNDKLNPTIPESGLNVKPLFNVDKSFEQKGAELRQK